MNLFKIGATLALVMAVISQAHAQNFYGSVGGGVLLPEKSELAVGASSGKVKFDTGTSFQAALGYEFRSGLRTELELGLNDTGFKNLRTATTTTAITGGDVDHLTLHAAGYYDFNARGVSPYVGAGFGLTRTDTDTYTVLASTAQGGRATDFSTFGEIGVSLPVTRRLTLAPGVRYSWVDANGGDFTSWTFRTSLRLAF